MRFSLFALCNDGAKTKTTLASIASRVLSASSPSSSFPLYVNATMRCDDKFIASPPQPNRAPLPRERVEFRAKFIATFDAKALARYYIRCYVVLCGQVIGL